MRRTPFATLLLLALLCVAPWARAQQLAAIPALDSPVVDTTGTLDAAAKQRLEQQALALQQRKGSQLQVLMIPSTQPEDIKQYTQRVFDAWKLGRKGIDDAVLVVVAKDDRQVFIETGYGLEGAIPDITAGRVIREYMAPKFRTGDFAGGLADATAQLVKLIDGEPLPEPMSEQGGDGGNGGGDWLFALLAAAIISQVARGLFGGLPAGVRAVLGAGVGGGIAWLFSSLLLVSGIGGLIGLLIGLTTARSGRYARDGGWGGFGGGGWGGGGFGGGGFGGSGGGWSGGGGMSGGGGASGSW